MHATYNAWTWSGRGRERERRKKPLILLNKTCTVIQTCITAPICAIGQCVLPASSSLKCGFETPKGSPLGLQAVPKDKIGQPGLPHVTKSLHPSPKASFYIISFANGTTAPFLHDSIWTRATTTTHGKNEHRHGCCIMRFTYATPSWKRMWTFPLPALLPALLRRLPCQIERQNLMLNRATNKDAPFSEPFMPGITLHPRCPRQTKKCAEVLHSFHCRNATSEIPLHIV